MNARTLVATVAILAALAAVVWGRSSLLKRITEVDSRLATVSARVEPIHSRCRALEGLLATAEDGIASIAEASSALSGTVASHAALILEDRTRLGRFGKSLVRTREEAFRSSSEIRSMLDEQVREAQATENGLAELVRQLNSLGDQRGSVPPGTILPWLPDGGGVPPGWLLCDGTLGAPDLRGLFLRGVGFFDEAGRYYDAAEMQPAGVHSHATEEHRSIDTVSRAAPQSSGDWLVLFDAGVGGSDANTQASHGSHVHEDEHVPAHFTVVFIMKAPQGEWDRR